MMPRLKAEEALAMVDQLAVGTGAMKDKADARRAIERWQTARDGGKRTIVRKQLGSQELGGMGIGIEMVKPSWSRF